MFWILKPLHSNQLLCQYRSIRCGHTYGVAHLYFGLGGNNSREQRDGNNMCAREFEGQPTTPMTSRLNDTSSTFDDLTAAIEDLSRIPSPEPVASLICCCGKENCDNFRSWLELKAKLSQRLVLSAGMSFVVVSNNQGC